MIKVTFETLENGAQNVGAAATNIEQKLEDLKRQLQPIVHAWEGSAKEAYEGEQRKWDSSAADLQRVLNQISIALRTAAENYRGAEQANLKRFA